MSIWSTITAPFRSAKQTIQRNAAAVLFSACTVFGSTIGIGIGHAGSIEMDRAETKRITDVKQTIESYQSSSSTLITEYQNALIAMNEGIALEKGKDTTKALSRLNEAETKMKMVRAVVVEGNLEEKVSNLVSYANRYPHSNIAVTHKDLATQADSVLKAAIDFRNEIDANLKLIANVKATLTK